MFDLDPSSEEVQEARERKNKIDPDDEEIVAIASDLTQNYIEGQAALIGGVTVLEGLQSTKTRRRLSNSIDLIYKDANIDRIGEEFTSWRYKGSNVASVEGVEVALLPIDEIDFFDFPESSVQNSYVDSFQDYELRLAEPEPNAASKLNTVTLDRKGNDPIDSASQINWMYDDQRADLEYFSDLISETVNSPYKALEIVEESGLEPFTETEKDKTKKAIEEIRKSIG